MAKTGLDYFKTDTSKFHDIKIKRLKKEFLMIGFYRIFVVLRTRTNVLHIRAFLLPLLYSGVAIFRGFLSRPCSKQTGMAHRFFRAY